VSAIHGTMDVATTAGAIAKLSCAWFIWNINWGLVWIDVQTELHGKLTEARLSGFTGSWVILCA